MVYYGNLLRIVMSKPGFIYFATLGDKSIKVGKFSPHLTCSAKERQYRTLDRYFTVRHAYYSDDVNTEEQRVLSVLRLVAGTEFKGAGKEVFTGISLKRAIAVSAEKTSAQLEEMARKAIDNLLVGREGTSVRTLLVEHNNILAMGARGGLKEAKRLLAIREVLWDYGIQVVSADDEDELDVAVYGKVINPLVLLKKAPALKPLQAVLDGLEF